MHKNVNILQRFSQILLLFLVIACAILSIGCDSLPSLPTGPKLVGYDADADLAHVAAVLAKATALSDGGGPSPTPDDTDPDGCDNCSNTGWMGDGQPRDNCPRCNDPVKRRKPSVQEYLRQIDEWRNRSSSTAVQAVREQSWQPTPEEFQSLMIGALESPKVKEAIAGTIIGPETRNAIDEILARKAKPEPDPYPDSTIEEEDAAPPTPPAKTPPVVEKKKSRQTMT